LSNLTETTAPSPVVTSSQPNLPPGEMAQVSTPPPSSGFPKWVFLLGGVILLAVVGASAYFILGVGRPQSTSLPAEQVPAVLTPTATPPAATSSATPSAGFGNLSGATPSSTTATGSSAFEILRQQQAK
jgi:hypothetical protein